MNSGTGVETTALVISSALGFDECVRILLKKGNDVNVTRDNGFTALIDTSSEGKVQCV